MIFGSSRKVGGANKCLGEAPKSCTRKEHESATNSIAKRGQGAIAPCRVKGRRPLWGLGQRPNCWSGDQYQESCQQRRRQQSVPASNFARPQTRPQASLANYYALSRQMGATTLPAASAHNPPKNLGTTAQLGGASADVFSAICGMQISRFTASKPSKFAFASDEKSIRQPTTSFCGVTLAQIPQI